MDARWSVRVEFCGRLVVEPAEVILPDRPHTPRNLAVTLAHLEFGRKPDFSHCSPDVFRRIHVLHRFVVDVAHRTLQAFELHALRGVPVGEAAEQLQLSKASVYQAKSRVLRRVKEQLDTLDPDQDV